MSNSQTRRTIIQAIYSNHFIFNSDVNEISKNEFLCDNIENEKLFFRVISNALSIWNNYEKMFEYLGFEFDLRSTVAIAIFKAFIAELFLEETDQKILIKEYLVLLNSFCPVEASVIKLYINKCVATDFLAKKEEWIESANSID